MCQCCSHEVLYNCIYSVYPSITVVGVGTPIDLYVSRLRREAHSTRFYGGAGFSPLMITQHYNISSNNNNNNNNISDGNNNNDSHFIIIIIITLIISMVSFSFFNFSIRGIRVQRAAFYDLLLRPS